MIKNIISIILFGVLLVGCNDDKIIDKRIPIVFPPNQAPIAQEDNSSVVAGESVTIEILANDSDSDGEIDKESVELLSQTEYGTVELNQSTGVVTYHSDITYSGEDSFSYQVQDNEGLASNEVSVTIMVTAYRAESTVESKPLNWYIRLVAKDEVRGLYTGSAQLGQLEEEDATIKHTLKAFNPFGGSYLDIIFPNPEGVSTGEYKVNYQYYEDGEEARWRFIVRTNDVNADISLSWIGIYILTPYMDDMNRLRYTEYQSLTNPLSEYMKLIDSSSGEEIKALIDGKANSYIFNMNGENERLFEWVVAVDKVLINKSKHSKIVIKKEKRVQSIKHIQPSFNMTNPPMIEQFKR